MTYVNHLFPKTLIYHVCDLLVVLYFTIWPENIFIGVAVHTNLR